LNSKDYLEVATKGVTDHHYATHFQSTDVRRGRLMPSDYGKRPTGTIKKSISEL